MPLWKNVKEIFILCVDVPDMKCEFRVNVNRALAASKQLLISVAHIILVNTNEKSKKIPIGSEATLLLYLSIKVANNYIFVWDDKQHF